MKSAYPDSPYPMLWWEKGPTEDGFGSAVYTYVQVTPGSFNDIVATAGDFSGGTGTESDPWLISTENDVKKLNIVLAQEGKYTSGNYRMTTSFDFTGVTDVPDILWGVSSGTIRFTGTFDGGENALINLTNGSSTSTSTVTNASIFGYLANATIKNLARIGGSTIGTSNIGAGIVAYSLEGTNRIENCFNSAYVNGSNIAAGIVGATHGTSSSSSSVTLLNCYNTGEIGRLESVTETETGGKGGIAGTGGDVLTFTNCYNTGTVTGNRPGGICGRVMSGPQFPQYSGLESMTVTNCYMLRGSCEAAIDTDTLNTENVHINSSLAKPWKVIPYLAKFRSIL